MNMNITICIPSYNRPNEISRLLNSIDSIYINNIDILICEDKSPKRNEISEIVNIFKGESKYNVIYHENDENLGYDRNIKNLVLRAKGDYIIFMGDDDVFIPNALDKMICFLTENKGVGYVLKSHRYIFNDKRVENFRYFEGNKIFDRGEETYIKLFRRSVFISGYTINRHYIENLIVDNFDGGLLYQMYLLAEVAMNHKCAYFDTPLTQAYEEGIPFFGSSETEKGKYTPGSITVDNSLNFLSGFFDITRFIDHKYNISSTPKIKKDMSKYFYPNLAIQRNKGLKIFLHYVMKLNKMGFNVSFYYYIYVIGLSIFGKKICDTGVLSLKSFLGKTPQL